MSKKDTSEEDPIEEIEAASEKAAKKPRAKARTTPTKKKVSKPSKKEPTPETPVKPSKKVSKKLKVNFWRTRLHDEELGVHQQLKYQAKTRWFSKNFDIEGVVEEDGEKNILLLLVKSNGKNPHLRKKGCHYAYLQLWKKKLPIRKPQLAATLREGLN